MRCGTGYPQPHQPQQALGGRVAATRFKGGRVGIFTPDTVILGGDPVAENIKKRHRRLIAFPPLGNIIQIVAWQRGIDTVHPQKGGANRRRVFRMVFVSLHRFQGADREAHPRPGPKTDGIIGRMAGAPQPGAPWVLLLQQLAEAVKIGPPDIFVKQ
ncbi:hypothetical protein SRDD_31950 [Serratia sp. DD3]|nr:hypothetical protein SRDD_31950 [Serratia sp. DD3]